MSDEPLTSLRLRNHAEELNLLAAEMRVPESLALLKIADSYAKMADLLEFVHRSKLGFKAVAAALQRGGNPSPHSGPVNNSLRS